MEKSARVVRRRRRGGGWEKPGDGKPACQITGETGLRAGAISKLARSPARCQGLHPVSPRAPAAAPNLFSPRMRRAAPLRPPGHR